MVLSAMDCDLMKQIQESYKKDVLIKEVIEALKKKTFYLVLRNSEA